jgi:ADP-ribose pyrophosphatase YjhB (NUDIX family)
MQRGSTLTKIGGHCAVLKETLYRYLGFTAAVSFNLLNLLLRGNLPPFGSACVLIREGERYLLLERSNGKAGLPGGFMRWRENPMETAIRECREETGLQVRILDLIGCFPNPTNSWHRMSTLTMVYSAEISGGRMRQALEGRPGWFLEAEASRRLDPLYQPLFVDSLRYYEQRTLPERGT